MGGDAQHPTRLYSSYTFTADGPSTEDVLQMLIAAKWLLKSLALEFRSDTDAILERVSESNQRLERLTLRRCTGSPSRVPVSSVSLFDILNRCNLLQHLSFVHTYCESRTFYNEIGLRLPSLKSVELFGEPMRISSKALKNIADRCRNLEEIEAVDFGANATEKTHEITDVTVSYLCFKCKYLSMVALNFNKCTDRAMFALATLSHLTELRLHMPIDITSIGFMAISDMPLEHLSVRGNHKTSTNGWLAFLQKPIIRQLKELRLLWCVNMNQEVVDTILNNPHNLQELFIVNWDQGVYCQRTFNPGNRLINHQN